MFKALTLSLRLGGGLFQTALLIIRTFRLEGWPGIARRWSNAKSMSAERSAAKKWLTPAEFKVIGTTPDHVPFEKYQPIIGAPAKLICFYLPQFHAIPENDAWWGIGFTEWTNVQPAFPLFEEHYQPRIPGELGYYNLLDPAIQKRQVELAKNYGIGGFCFYFYWFAGKRLLEQPVINYLENNELDFPFCLCWANENWSRRWDGLDSEVLIAQEHSPEDDLAFISYISRYLRDPRYIRVNGKPLVVVYRPSLLPSAKETAIRWRKWCAEHGLGEIYLAYTQSFESVDPESYGFDAAIEFPPNNSAPSIDTDSVKPLAEDFNCTVYDWSSISKTNSYYKQPPYRLFRGVCPGWDNTARRKNRSTVLINNTPNAYQNWLKNAISATSKYQKNNNERMVFINAWNEWAEGAYLEPDVRYGYAWLQATRNALTGDSHAPSSRRQIILVTHDAYHHGAQMLAANLAKTLHRDMGFRVDLVCLGEGPLLEEYAKWSTVHLLASKDARGQEARRLAENLYCDGHRYALINTTVSGLFASCLHDVGINCVVMVHELKGIIDQHDLHEHAKTIATKAKAVVFATQEVATAFQEVAPIEKRKIHLRPQGLYKRRSNNRNRSADRLALRRLLGLPAHAKIILAVGYADHRKGVDLFVQAGLSSVTRNAGLYWVWNGNRELGMEVKVEGLLSRNEFAKERILFPGYLDTDLFYGGADVYALTSREDPFPSVVLEALDHGLPVVGFEGAGGFCGLLKNGCGLLVEHSNQAAFADAVVSLIEDEEQCGRLGQTGQKIVNIEYSFNHYAFDLIEYAGMPIEKISVIVPNYNYAHYLPQRLESIVKQDYPIYEVIILDDCSNDESVEVARDFLSKQSVDYCIIKNDVNSGSVFKQWKKGVDLARGGRIWIAEADDLSEPIFISEALKGFRTPGVVMSYCESKQIDERGVVLVPHYHDYLSDLDARRWYTPFVLDGPKVIQEYLCIKSIVPNVSAVIFDAKALRRVLDEHIEEAAFLRIAGDWYIYMQLLRSGALAFSPAPLNGHRRHQKGVTISSFNDAHLGEIRAMQEMAQSLCSIEQSKLDAARQYVQKLERQFDCAEIKHT